MFATPGKGPLGIGAKFLEEGLIASPKHGFGEDPEPQRSGIDRAVIGCVWHLFHARHFAVAHFVWDLARFFFLALIDHSALERGQGAQGADRALRSDVQSLERGDETVPAEWGDEPG